MCWSNEVFKDFKSDMAVGIGKLCNLTWETAESHVIVMHKAGSQILTLDLQAKKSDLCDIGCIFVKLYTTTYWNDWLRKTQFIYNAMQFIAL